MLYVYFWEDCIYLVNFLALIENVVGASMFNWFISTSMPIWHSAPPPMVPSIEPSTTTVSGTSCTCSKIKHQLKELNIHITITVHYWRHALRNDYHLYIKSASNSLLWTELHWGKTFTFIACISLTDLSLSFARDNVWLIIEDCWHYVYMEHSRQLKDSITIRLVSV